MPTGAKEKNARGARFLLVWQNRLTSEVYITIVRLSTGCQPRKPSADSTCWELNERLQFSFSARDYGARAPTGRFHLVSDPITPATSLQYKKGYKKGLAARRSDANRSRSQAKSKACAKWLRALALPALIVG